MSRFGQIGIALSALGVVLALMGLFPGLTGLEPTLGIGVIQVLLLLIGYALLLWGAYLYLKFTFYWGIPTNLIQQIGTRLALTGLLFASLAGLADIFGFGSHLRTDASDIFFGQWQAFGVIASFALAAGGIVVYALGGYRHMRIDPSPEEIARAMSTQPLPVIKLDDAKLITQEHTPVKVPENAPHP